MCSDLSLPNRGNSYFVYLRADSDVIQWYEVTNDVFTLVHSVPFTIEVDSSYDVKIWYSKITGDNKVFINNVLIGNWTDSTPLTVNTGISFRSGNCSFKIDYCKIYRQRTSSTMTSVGNNKDFFTCNPTFSVKAGKIESICIDAANLIGSNTNYFNVDFTPPINSIPTESTIDTDTLFNTMTLLLANLMATDTNSAINSTKVCVLSYYSNDTIMGLTNYTGNNLLSSLSGLISDSLYRIGLVSTNNAGLTNITFSDGFRYYNNLSIEQLTLSSIIVYPNPATHFLTIQNTNSTLKIIQIFSLDGKLMDIFNLENEYILSLENYAAGSYYLVTENVVFKFLKE